MEYINEIFKNLSKFFQWWVMVMPWERGIRVRLGNKVKVLTEGVHFKIPFLDIVYVQTTRLRAVSTPVQTVSTRDKQTLTIVAVVGYSIKDIYKFYNTLFHPEATICNMVLSEMADYISTHDLSNCSPNTIEASVIDKLVNGDFGVNYEYVKIIGYAVVRTYRLIQDGHYVPDGISMIDHK